MINGQGRAAYPNWSIDKFAELFDENLFKKVYIRYVVSRVASKINPVGCKNNKITISIAIKKCQKQNLWFRKDLYSSACMEVFQESMRLNLNFKKWG